MKGQEKHARRRSEPLAIREPGRGAGKAQRDTAPRPPGRLQSERRTDGRSQVRMLPARLLGDRAGSSSVKHGDTTTHPSPFRTRTRENGNRCPHEHLSGGLTYPWFAAATQRRRPEHLPAHGWTRMRGVRTSGVARTRKGGSPDTRGGTDGPGKLPAVWRTPGAEATRWGFDDPKVQSGQIRGDGTETGGPQGLGAGRR